ncbi:MAG: glycosyltransferase family 4 protein [Acetobacter okinawensis]|uniref:glycosyltransferase family 4 protein n=1 Tax=Acetobacter okinawensis TaxID=1076594 RepID=UPI0039E74D56
MRVGFLIQHINGLGGTERTACAVMNGLVEHTSVSLIELWSQGSAAYGLDPRVQTVSLFSRHMPMLSHWGRLVWQCYRQIRALKLDVLVVVESTHALYGVAACRLAGIRCVVWEHFNCNVDMGKRKRRWGRWIAARWADDIVTLTSRDIALWRQKLAPKARLVCIPNMVPALPPVQYDPDSRHVVAIGRLTHQKGFDRLLAAWEKIIEDRRSTGWVLQIIGSGPELDQLQGKAESLAHIEFLPARKDVSAVYARTGILVSTSRYEGLPMVMLEAEAAGIPIVAFDCETGPAEIIASGQTGFLVTQDDAEGFAHAVLELMGDRDMRMRFSTAAKVRSNLFSPDKIMEKWRCLLKV